MATDGQQFPVGHPQVFLRDFPPIQDIFGLVKAIVNPPTNLFIPVLPVFDGSKVIFGLCGSCIEEGNNEGPCPHEGTDRYLHGTFVSGLFCSILLVF